jgi:site-specific DNA recombinase
MVKIERSKMGKTRKLKGFGYYRTSGTTGKQNRGYGLASQKKDVRDYCEENGIELVGEYLDDGVSGCEYEKSFSLLEMLDDLEKCDVIVSKSSCRLFGRDHLRITLVKRALMKFGKKVFLTDNPSYDLYSKDPNDFLVNGFMELLDQYERMTIATKLAKSRRNRVLTGRRGSGRYPLGYMNTIDKETIINPKTRPIVEFLFSNYDPDYTDKTLAGLSRSVKEKFGVKLTPSGIRKILLNRFYIGWIKHGKMAEVVGKHETFISKKRFGMVGKMLLRNIG